MILKWKNKNTAGHRKEGHAIVYLESTVTYTLIWQQGKFSCSTFEKQMNCRAGGVQQAKAHKSVLIMMMWTILHNIVGWKCFNCKCTA